MRQALRGARQGRAVEAHNGRTLAIANIVLQLVVKAVKLHGGQLRIDV